ncbi:hypothetical protein EJ070_13385 [Mesorhizobium sp. M1E.F.Ca.ET.045.02.1.1]|nr:hypothetical protein EJ070_13385 [Mesorhizobium sp. M1E.F.Ca.ET.045.02.1.1]
MTAATIFDDGIGVSAEDFIEKRLVIGTLASSDVFDLKDFRELEHNVQGAFDEAKKPTCFADKVDQTGFHWPSRVYHPLSHRGCAAALNLRPVRCEF